MTAAQYNSIAIEPANGLQRVTEKPANGVIRPGDLLEVEAADTLVVLGAAAANAQKLVALENVADAGGIADNYADGDRVRALFAQPGDVILMTLADSMTIVTGDPLETGLAGSVQAWVAGTLIGHAAEPVTTSGAEARIRVRVA